MPRILYVTDGISPWVVGGMQSVSREHVTWLGEAGYDVLAITSRVPPEPKAAELSARLEFVPWPKSPTLAKINPWKYARELQRFSAAILPLVDDFHPDVIYAEGPLLDDLLARPKDRRPPVVFHPHGQPRSLTPRPTI